ncbi:hypothetical protein B0H17DRAFT_1200669 [Mycena rosella]|uniref:Uncharacterized protein n=1 Tax=Mycena rosella TaxID=1033263 RepID=A0AAD7DHT5_MYCRO|nr:hypothetical protein B0H17DRAFT_1200669 [Mycena rosella]
MPGITRSFSPSCIQVSAVVPAPAHDVPPLHLPPALDAAPARPMQHTARARCFRRPPLAPTTPSTSLPPQRPSAHPTTSSSPPPHMTLHARPPPQRLRRRGAAPDARTESWLAGLDSLQRLKL